MRTLHHIIILLLFTFFAKDLIAQLTIKEGKTNLAYKEISIKEINCKIIPEVKFSFENPNVLLVKIKVEWEDEKGNNIDDSGNHLYLIDNWDKFINDSKERGIYIGRSPQIQTSIEKSVPIEAFQNEQKIEVEKFESGYNGFRKESAPLKIYLDYVSNTEINLKFNFVYITRKDKIVERPYFKEWSFRLPEKVVVKSVDCRKLEKQFEGKVDKLTKYDLTYFKTQLKRENIDIDKLAVEFQNYKGNIKKAKDLHTVLNYNKDLDECPDVKIVLLGQLEIFLLQKEESVQVEDGIIALSRNICNHFEDKYTSRLNELKVGQNLAYFRKELNKTNPDIFKLEDEFSLYKKSILNIQKLKVSITDDPNSEKCSEEKNDLIKKIDRILAGNKDAKSIDIQIRSEKRKLSQNKELSFESYESIYEAAYAKLDEEYIIHDEELSGLKKALIARYKENSYRIRLLKETGSKKDEISADSLNSLTRIFNLCKSENRINLDITDSVVLKLDDFSTRVGIKKRECKNDFLSVDKQSGLKKAKPLLDIFSKLIYDIENLKSDFDVLKDEIKKNNEGISNFNKIFNPEKEISARTIISKYESLFEINVKEINGLDKEYSELINDFEGKKYDDSYYKWVKGGLYDKGKKIEKELHKLQVRQDSLIASKEVEFEKNRIVKYLGNIQDFKQIEASLRPRLELVISDIESWPHKPFPVFFLIIGAVVLLILGFGGKVYFNAIRKKKKEQIKITVAKENGSGSGITIKKTPESNSGKGKGLASVRKLIGTEFFEIDLSYEWDDSAVSKVYFKRDCIIKTYRFFEDSVKSADTDSTAFETGGYLIGRWDYNSDDPKKYDVSLDEFIEPGDDAKFSHYQLNFGAKIGIKLQKVLTNFKQKANLDYVMTAWFHSHPGLKIFLSDFDLSVQEGFSQDRESLKMVAIVLDPYTKLWDTGFFTYKADGSAMNNAKDSKRFFSLDRMYKWALSRDKEITGNYFSVDLLDFYDDSISRKIYFENPLILEMKRYFEDNKESFKNKLSVYLEGRQIVHDYIFSDIILEKITGQDKTGDIKDEDKVNRIACIIGTDGDLTEINSILTSLEENDGHLLLVLLYNFVEQSITIISKNKRLTFNKPLENGKVLLTDMIDWTRKRK